jgi:hypothetical protein
MAATRPVGAGDTHDDVTIRDGTVDRWARPASKLPHLPHMPHLGPGRSSPAAPLPPRRLVGFQESCVPSTHPVMRLSTSFHGHVHRAKRFNLRTFLREEAVTITLTLLGALGILLLQFVAWKEIPSARLLLAAAPALPPRRR